MRELTDTPKVSCAPRPDAIPERELDTLATVYRFILDSHEKRAAGPSSPDDAEGDENDRDASIVP